jgi:hypothetical protein
LFIVTTLLDFGELNSNFKIGDAKAFNFPSSPSPMQTSAFKPRFKSEGLGDFIKLFHLIGSNKIEVLIGFKYKLLFDEL